MYRNFVELPAKKQPLLDYFWDINRDWERLQRTTTVRERLTVHMYNFDNKLYFKSCYFIMFYGDR